MRSKTTIAQPVKHSSRVLRKVKKNLIEPVDFAEVFGGSLQMKLVGGCYYCGFQNEEQRAHAWGSSFTRAYRNMLKNFHEKYMIWKGIKNNLWENLIWAGADFYQQKAKDPEQVKKIV